MPPRPILVSALTELTDRLVETEWSAVLDGTPDEAAECYTALDALVTAATNLRRECVAEMVARIPEGGDLALPDGTRLERQGGWKRSEWANDELLDAARRYVTTNTDTGEVDPAASAAFAKVAKLFGLSGSSVKVGQLEKLLGYPDSAFCRKSWVESVKIVRPAATP